MASGLGVPISTGLVMPEAPQHLEGLVAMARQLPPHELSRRLPPQLAEIVSALAAQRGLRVTPALVQPEVQRVVRLLVGLRELPEAELRRRAPEVFQEIREQSRIPGLFAPIAWTPYVDGALAIPLAAGLAGGLPVGLGVGGLGALQRLGGRGVPWPLVLPTLLAGLVGGVLARRWPEDAWQAGGGFGLGAAAGLLQMAWVLHLSPAGFLSPPVLLGSLVVAGGHGVGLATYLLLVRAARLEDQRRAAEAAEVSGRLALLSAQVRPHFLFNALNTLAAEIHQDPARARHLVDCLARFLRRSLRPDTGGLALGVELEDLGPYLELERARFEDRLVVCLEVPEPLRTREVPGLLLQPLVENAVHHGMRAEGVLHVRVRARETPEGLELVVEDDGRGAPPQVLARLNRGEGGGIGTTSVRAKLAARTPPGRLGFEARAGGGLVARLALPAGGRP